MTALSDDQLLENPVVIVGAPRSGTTIMGRFLEPHPMLHSALEPRLVWRYGNDGKSDMLRPEDARPDVVRYIRRTFAKQVRDAGKTRLLEKTPSNALRLGFVDRVFSDCKYVHIMRNGLDSVLSIRSFWIKSAHGIKGVEPGRLGQRLREVGVRRLPMYAAEALRRFMPGPGKKLIGRNVWGPRIPGIRGLMKELDLLEVCCLQWRMCVESACLYGRALPSDRYLEIRLEDLSPKLLADVLAFAKLDDDPAVWEKFNREFDPSLAGARKSTATPQEIETILRWIEPTMAWLGYE